jgi:hypothetical protein
MDGAGLAVGPPGGDVGHQLGGWVTVTAALFTSGASRHHGALRCLTLRQSDNLIGPPGLLGCPFQSPGPPGPGFGNPRAWGHDAHRANMRPILRHREPRSLIRGGQSHPDQHPDCVRTGWMAGLPAAPFINLLAPLRLKSKTDDWDLASPRSTALFSYYVIRIGHKPYYAKTSFGEI